MMNWEGTARNTGEATASHGIAISGINTGDIQLTTPRPARSAYRRQVERIAPAELVERAAELAVIAEFCTANTGPSYLWWQAGAWAGKSAMMSWFALHPPPGVSVVSFFVTARFSGQNDRSAFINVVMEQLAEVADLPIPSFLTEATREAHLLDLLEQAAVHCTAKGRRLILLVDGLDEDRGVTTAPDAYSIAAILPASPPSGARVIVAGRPNPPVPADVPENHPLRDPAVVRVLAPSARASVVKADAERELKQLLQGPPLEQDLLGLVAAAGGGLSDADLARLTDLTAWEVEDRLHSVAGRTFTGRAGQLGTRGGPKVYVLAHEELQASALRYLGSTRIDGYRDRLHAWAASFRDAGWPAGTPEYLLLGYFQLLAQLGDLFRMVECATDTGRQNRMLDVTGGDSAALTEIALLEEMICAQDVPDLAAMLTLGINRDRLIRRNASIPVNLPAAWAKLGHQPRAEALAQSISDPTKQVRALTQLGGVLATAGDKEQVRRVVVRAATVAQLISQSYARTRALARIPGVLAAVGDVDGALAAAAVADPYQQVWALAQTVRTLIAAGDLDGGRVAAGHVESVIESMAPSGERTRAMIEWVTVLAACGDRVGAEAVVRSVTEPYWQVWAQTELVRVLADGGEHDRAGALAYLIANPYWRAQSLIELARSLAARGDNDEVYRFALAAGQEASHASGQRERARLLIQVAEMVAESGDLPQALAIARSIDEAGPRAQALAQLAGICAARNDLPGAEHLLSEVTDPDVHVWGLAEVAAALGDCRNVELGARYATAAESKARSIDDPDGRARALTAMASALLAIGETSKARVHAVRAWSFASRGGESFPWVALASLFALVGDLDTAKAVAVSIDDPRRKVEALSAVARRLVRAGDLAEGEALVRSIDDRDQRQHGLIELATELVSAGHPQRAVDTAWSAGNLYLQTQPLQGLATALSESGNFDIAEQVCLIIAEPGAQLQALVGLAESLPPGGHLESRRRLAGRTQRLARRASVSAKETTTIKWARVVGAGGDFDMAARLIEGLGLGDRGRTILAEIKARAAARAGDSEQVAAVLDSRPEGQCRVDILVSVLPLVCAAGDHESIERLADYVREVAKISDPAQRVRSASALFGSLSTVPGLTPTLRFLREESVSAVREIHSRGGRFDAIITILRHLGHDGETVRALADEAEELAGALDDKKGRAGLLTDLAEVAEHGRAQRLLAQTLRSGSWLMPLSAVARVDPAAVVEASDYLLE